MIGHDRILDFLQTAVDKDRLAHAYLLVGPEHVGKTTLARIFARHLLGHGGHLDTHPDFFLIRRECDAKSGKPHQAIVIGQVRALCEKLAMGAFMGGWKVCIIAEAEALNQEAANALLKTLEEPHPKTLLLLVATSAENVMPTIRSRCQVISFGRVAASRIRDALRERGVNEPEAQLFSRLADGCPGRAFRFVEDAETLEDMRKMRRRILGLHRQDTAERWRALDGLLPNRATFIETAARAGQVMDLMAELLRDTLLIGQGRRDDVVHVDVRDEVEAWGRELGTDRVLSALESLETARSRVRSNVGPRAVLEHLALALPL
ncbi:hypothetical protein AMJ57_00150 [Parcubacteria bacterium SG8_24]|nr:MAG: hypothetical protein AMJ57_00150 [Parcubacteria bacterium SG8_24]